MFPRGRLHRGGLRTFLTVGSVVALLLVCSPAVGGVRAFGAGVPSNARVDGPAALVVEAAASLGCSVTSGGLLGPCTGSSAQPVAIPSVREINGSAWIPDPQGTAPSPRYGAAMVDDVGDGYVLLFGGGATPPSGGLLVYGDTWIFAGGAWSNITSIVGPGPAPRVDAGITYDPSDGYVVMFGGATGFGGRTVLNDTWAYRNDLWTNLTKGTAPSPRAGAVMAADTADSTVVLFGGCAPENCTSSTYNDTWEFKAGVWSDISAPSPIPAARAGAALTYDAADGYLVMFGGTTPTARLNDTWTFRSGKWLELFPTAAPSGRLDAGLVYDPSLASVVLFGGKYYGDFYSDTWLFRAGIWSSVSSSLPNSPAPRGDPGLVFDPALSALLLQGGQTFFPDSLNDTWVLTADSGNLSGTVTPKDATVAVDGRTVEVVSGGFREALLPGDHSVLALADGYVSETMSVAVQQGATSVVTITLKPVGSTPVYSNTSSPDLFSTTAWLVIVVLTGTTAFFLGTTLMYRTRGRTGPPER
jgi:hypothetical protein